METLLAFLIGVGLSATCGFRVFVPLFGIGLAVHSGHLSVGSGFEWVGSDAAMMAFGIAAILEVAAYYVPWLDNLLDTISTPAAVIAGSMITAAMISDMSPLLRWSLAVIAGGGAAATVQSVTVALRGVSSGTTGGLANPLVSTGEAVFATVGTVTSILSPVLAIILIGAFVVAAGRPLLRRFRPTPVTVKE